LNRPKNNAIRWLKGIFRLRRLADAGRRTGALVTVARPFTL
jgi:hypothetical protein